MNLNELGNGIAWAAFWLACAYVLTHAPMDVIDKII